MQTDRLRGLLAPVAAIAVLAAGCAPKQTIPLGCVPKDVTLYVDKTRLEEIPDELDLRADEPHILYFKGGGYQPAQVILETEDTENGPKLSPSDVCVQVRFVEMQREVELELEAD